MDVCGVHRLPVLLLYLRLTRPSFFSVEKIRNCCLIILKSSSLLDDRVAGSRATATAFRTRAVFAAVDDLVLKKLGEMTILFNAVFLTCTDLWVLDPAALSVLES